LFCLLLFVVVVFVVFLLFFAFARQGSETKCNSQVACSTMNRT
jgi:hypothetical protein